MAIRLQSLLPPFLLKMHKYSIVFILLTIFTAQIASAQNDSIAKMLETIVITGNTYTSPLKNSNPENIKLDMRFMHQLPKILGNADPIRHSQLLPGIQTNSEYENGVHIYGCENSHNIISINKIPIYNATHLLGIFSVFTPSHFSNISFTLNNTAENNFNRLGGIMNMELFEEIPEKFKGEYTIGVMSSQGIFKIPINRKKALYLSLRASYLNLLYSSLLTIDNSKLEYSFADINATYLQKINNRNSFILNLYTGADNASLKEDEKENKESETKNNLDLLWGNLLLSAHWNYKSCTKEIEQSLYFTGYKSKFNVSVNDVMKITSGVYDFGYKAKMRIKNINFGLSLVQHYIKPQKPNSKTLMLKQTEQKDEKTLEAGTYISYSQNITDNLLIKLVMKGNLYRHHTANETYCSADPSIILSYTKQKVGKFALTYSTQHQYMHNSGFTSLGLPIEFWFSSDSYKKPQYAHSLIFNYGKEIFGGKYNISVSAYYKRLYHQLEYKGSPLDLFNSVFSLNNVLIFGNGYNYGGNITINKCSGKITGWISYSYGRARRRFDIYGKEKFPATHERPHEINAVIAYRINKKIDFGGTFVYASGTPFTAPNRFYMLNGNIISEYGKHNANRLSPYIRLDLSINYDIINNNDKKAGVNISIYNALMRENEIYYRLDISQKRFAYRSFSFFAKILPSISFYYSF